MKSKCLQCREANARSEKALHPSMWAAQMLVYMRTPRAVKNNKPCEAHGGQWITRER